MANLKGYDFPDDLLYHEEHAWARIEEDGTDFSKASSDTRFLSAFADLSGPDEESTSSL